MTEGPAFSFRPYQPGDEHAINRGFNEIFGLKRPIEQWNWKFRPGEDGSRIMLAVDASGEILAHFAVIRERAQVHGRALTVGQAVDNYRAPRPGTEGLVVFSELVRAFYKRYGRPGELAFLFGFPGERHMKLGRRYLGYCDPVPVPVFQRRLSYLGRLGRGGALSLPGPRVDAAADRLWDRARTRYPVAVLRDGLRLDRRYFSRPGHAYSFLTAGTEEALDAWAVVQVEGRTVRWVDLLWDGRDPGAIVSLDDQATRVARAARARRLEMWLGRDPEAAAVLLSRGWRPVPHPERLELTSTIFDSSIDGPSLVREFYLTMGDSDLV